MSKTWRKRLGIGAAVVGGIGLGVAGKDSLKGFAKSAGDSLGGLVGQLAKGRPLGDFLPTAADVKDSLEDLIVKTPAGQAARQDAMISRIGAFLTSPVGIGAVVLSLLGVFLLMRRR